MKVVIGNAVIEAENTKEIVEKIYEQRVWQDHLTFDEKMEILIDSLNRFTDLDISKYVILAGDSDEVKATRLVAALKEKEILKEI